MAWNYSTFVGSCNATQLDMHEKELIVVNTIAGRQDSFSLQSIGGWFGSW